MWRFLRTFMMLALVIALGSQLQSAQAQGGRQVWAYYFGWYTGESWGDGRLSDRPAAPYDSRDSGVIGSQIDAAKGAGIDAFIMSWFGPKNDNLTHQVFNMLLDQAAARGFHAAVSLDLADPGYNANVDEVIQSLQYVMNDRANHGGYLRFNGKPVIYFWNQGRYSAADWQNIRAQVDPAHNAYWVAEGTSTALVPIFDGIYLFNTAWSANPAATAAQYMNATVNAGGSFYTPTVLPGWDESAVAGRENPTSPQDRAGGAFLTNSWNGAASSGAGAILIVSWNEYLENSHIEPSQNFGTLALDTLRPLIANWKAGGGGIPLAAAPANTTAPGANTITPTILLNVRAGAGLDQTILGQISPGDVFEIRGEQNGWYQIDYNGGAGFVSGQFVTVGQGGSTAGGPAGTATGVTLTVVNNLRLRTEPNTAAQVITVLPFNTVLDAVGRNGDSTWVQVNSNGGSGWVFAEFANLSADISTLPVTE